MGYIYHVYPKDGSNNGYIGQTKKKSPEERWNQHRNNKTDDDYFHNALRAHGPENFIWKVVIICFDDDLNAYEAEYIEKYNVMRPNGYNLQPGGKGGKPGPEFGQKISAAKKGRPNGLLGTLKSDETKQKMSDASKGKKKSPDHCMSLSLAKRGKPNVKKGVPVIQLKDGVEIARFYASTEAGRVTGINYKHIHAVCKGERWRKTAGGFQWKFETTLSTP